MKRLLLPVLFVTFAISQNVFAANSPTAGASVVSLEKDCGAVVDCFDNLADLDQWVENTREPDANSPLTVNIGNGNFIVPPEYAITCDDNFTGYISFRGQGVHNSTIQIGQAGSFIGFYEFVGCEGMNFSDHSINTASVYGYIFWKQGGTSTWHDMEINGKGASWLEGKCGATPGRHYWYSSEINSTQALTAGRGYVALCDHTWIYGSEVTVIAPDGGDDVGNQANQLSAIQAASISSTEPEVHVYGSNIRAISHDVVNSLQGTINAGKNSHIHIHGTGIDSISHTGQDIAVLTTSNGGFIHANESSYVIKTSGDKYRIINNGGEIKAPYVWESGVTPPDIISVNGADSVILTSGSYPVMYIYDDTCSNNWRSVTGVCL